ACYRPEPDARSFQAEYATARVVLATDRVGARLAPRRRGLSPPGPQPARRRDPERSHGRRRLGAPRGDPSGRRPRDRRGDQASARFEGGIPPALGEDARGDGHRDDSRCRGRRRSRRRRRSCGRRAAHQAALVDTLRARQDGSPADSPRVPVHRVSGDPARGEQGPRAAHRPHVHGPGHLHLRGLSVVERPSGPSRALCPELAQQRARPLQAARWRSPRPADRHRAVVLSPPYPRADAPGRGRRARRPPRLDRHANEEHEANGDDEQERGGSTAVVSADSADDARICVFARRGGLLQALRNSVPARQRGNRLHPISRQAARPHRDGDRSVGVDHDGDDPDSGRAHPAQSGSPAERGGTVRAPSIVHVALLAVVAAVVLSACEKAPAPAAPRDREWQLLASELPSALLSVSGRSSTDIYAVGADKGQGPLVLHFDGKAWKELHTGRSGDLWWVQAFPNGPVLMAGASATVLRFDGQRFERMTTPGLGRQTVYGVWGKNAEDFYAVGSAGGRNGFVWHYHAGGFEEETLPLDLPRISGGELPGFFQVFGRADEVWVVGAAGAILHRKGSAPFAVVPTTTRDTLFTVHGVGDRLVGVGGAGNGMLLEGTGGGFRDASPPASGLIQGIFTTDRGDWASGERGVIYTRAQPGGGSFTAVDHGLALPAVSSLHSIFVDDTGGVWSAGGNVLSPALDNGMLVHFGARVPAVVIEEDEATPDAGAPAVCPAAVAAAGKTGSIARRWNEQALAAIRVDLPRPPIHARNLFHLSAA